MRLRRRPPSQLGLRDSHISNPRNPGFQSRFDTIHPHISIVEHSQHEKVRPSTKCEKTLRDFVEKLSDSKTWNSSRPSPEVLFSFARGVSLEATPMSNSIEPEIDTNFRRALRAVDNVARIRRDKSWLACPPSRCSCSAKHKCTIAPRSEFEGQDHTQRRSTPGREKTTPLARTVHPWSNTERLRPMVVVNSHLMAKWQAFPR